jgi:hypothetical protein
MNPHQEARNILAEIDQIHRRFPQWVIWRDRAGTWSATHPRYGGLKWVTSRSRLDLIDRITRCDGIAETQPIPVQGIQRQRETL